MKRCLHCGSVNADDEATCGVCGASLASSPVIKLQQVAGAETQPAPIRTRGRRVAIAFLIVIIGLTTLAIAGMIFLGPIGALLFLAVVLVVIVGMDTFNDEGVRPLFFGRRKSILRFSYGRGGADAMDREATREEQEQRDRESGAAD